MNSFVNLRVSVGTALFVPMLMLLLTPITPANPAESAPLCTTANCAKQKAVLRQLERTRPSRKMTRKQIFNRIKAACDQMRTLDCPDIRNYRPSICFTDF